MSASGFTAAFAAPRRPERFGNVLSVSGSFYWIPGTEDCERDDQGDEWLAEQYRRRPPPAPRFFLAAGRLESGRLQLSNRRMRDALCGLGYAVHYTEFTCGHDCLFHPHMFAEGLATLVGRTGV